MNRNKENTMSDHTLQSRIISFNQRELDCLNQITQGKSVLEAAKNLSLKQYSLYYYLKNISKKLDVLANSCTERPDIGQKASGSGGR
jgi:DNA-binding CsgD family transcriptional regulator